VAEEPQGQREQQARYLTYTERFLWSAVQRGELHPRSYELMLERVNAGLASLGYAPLISRFSRPPERTAAGAGGAAPTAGAVSTEAASTRGAARPEPLTGRQLGMTWLLYLGAFFLFLAAVTFTAFGWQEFSDVLKFIIVATYTVGLFGVSVLARRVELPQAEATFFWLGTATVPITVGAFVAFVLGVPMETTIESGDWWRPRWLPLELLGTGLLFLVLERWRENLGLRVAGLAAIAFAPLAQLATAEELAPVAAAGIALAYTAAAGIVPEGGWRRATRWTATVVGGVALLIAAGSGLARFVEELRFVHGDPLSSVEVDVSAALAFGMLAITAYLARRQGWWASRLPEAALAGVTATALVTAFGLGDIGDAGRLAYLAALLVPAAYAVAGRPWETLVSAAAPLVAIGLLASPDTLLRAAAPALELGDGFVASDLLVAVAATIACGLAAVALYRRGPPDRELAMPVGAVAAVILLAAWFAVIPLALPWPSLVLTAVGCVLLVVSARTEPRIWAPAAGVALAFGLVGAFSYLVLGGTGLLAESEAAPSVDPGWWLVVYFGLTAATTLVLRYLAEWGRRLGVAFVSLAWLSVLFAYATVEQDVYVFLTVAAVIAYAASFLYEQDTWRPVGTFLASIAVITYVDTLVAELDDGIVLLLLTPAFVHAGVAWWAAEDPVRRAIRSVSLVVVPLLVLGAGAATGYGDDVTTFLYIVLLGSGFAVVGFTMRIAGFAGVGLVFVLFASYRFLAPYISYIPAWVGFGIVGVLLLTAYFVWVRLRGRSISDTIPTTGWR
jgi:hypothetical protein